MILLQLFICVIIVYNMTQILVESELFAIIRKIPLFGTKLLSCFLCTSVWVGALVSKNLFDICLVVFDDGNFTLFYSTMLYAGLAYLTRVLEG